MQWADIKSISGCTVYISVLYYHATQSTSLSLSITIVIMMTLLNGSHVRYFHMVSEAG